MRRLVTPTNRICAAKCFQRSCDTPTSGLCIKYCRLSKLSPQCLQVKIDVHTHVVPHNKPSHNFARLPGKRKGTLYIQVLCASMLLSNHLISTMVSGIYIDANVVPIVYRTARTTCSVHTSQHIELYALHFIAPNFQFIRSLKLGIHALIYERVIAINVVNRF